MIIFLTCGKVSDIAISEYIIEEAFYKLNKKKFNKDIEVINLILFCPG